MTHAAGGPGSGSGGWRTQPRRGPGGRPYQEPRPIGDLLPQIMRGLRPKNRRGLARIQAAWIAVAGEKTASRSRVTSLEGGVLRIELQSAALKHHLATFRTAELLEELNRRFPEAGVRTLRFVIGKPA
ncbi:MAG: DUF721 domain-containing protein [Planctomycetota bacterium]